MVALNKHLIKKLFRSYLKYSLAQQPLLKFCLDQQVSGRYVPSLKTQRLGKIRNLKVYFTLSFVWNFILCWGNSCHLFNFSSFSLLLDLFSFFLFFYFLLPYSLKIRQTIPNSFLTVCTRCGPKKYFLFQFNSGIY